MANPSKTYIPLNERLNINTMAMKWLMCCKPHTFTQGIQCMHMIGRGYTSESGPYYCMAMYAHQRWCGLCWVDRKTYTIERNNTPSNP